MNIFFFIALPYISILILILGSVYKFKSAKSSLILNSNDNINIDGARSTMHGAPFFYVGLWLLILGHFIGFLFPSLVIAWNEKPVRLMIIEIAAFGFALTTFFSLIIFIINQIKQTVKLKELSFSNFALIALRSSLFAILIILILSGLFVANFYRWGTSWYAAVMTPYLRSLVKFYPDISAVEVMQFPIKIHVISAFLIIALFPFTGLFSGLLFYLNYFAGNKQGVFLRTVGLFSTCIIAASLALYFGNRYEMKKAVNIVHLVTKDNKVVDFENKLPKDTTKLSADIAKSQNKDISQAK